jgi:hypothetical protein
VLAGLFAAASAASDLYAGLSVFLYNPYSAGFFLVSLFYGGLSTYWL